MGFSSRFSTVAVALLSSTLFLQETLSQLTTTECQTSAGDFDYEVTLGSDFEVRWTVDTAAETISFEVSTAAEAWISVGFSSNGEMVGSDAVIGLLGDAETVEEYDLTGQALELVIVSEEQEITDSTVTQDDTGTTLTFTRPLAPTASGKQTLSATPGDETIILFAFGSDNELAYHSDNRGVAQLDLFCGDDAGSESGIPTATPSTSAPMADTETLTPSLAPVDGGEDGEGGGSTTMTSAPTAMPESASEPPAGAEDSEEDTTRDADTDAAFRVTGGLWAAAATVATAMLGAAMAV